MGTLLVDGVLVSCYTNTDHWLAHTALVPLRWYPSLLLDNEYSQDKEGLRTIPGMVKELGKMLGLVTLDMSGYKETKTLPCSITEGSTACGFPEAGTGSQCWADGLYKITA